MGISVTVPQGKVLETLKPIFAHGDTVWRVYWKATEPASLTFEPKGTLVCKSGKTISPVAAEKLIDLEARFAYPLIQQYYAVPQAEMPTHYQVGKLKQELTMRTMDQIGEEGDWAKTPWIVEAYTNWSSAEEKPN